MLQLYFLLTLHCNLNCNFCIRKYGKSDTDCNVRLDEAIQQMKNAASIFSKDDLLILSGGEPTIHSNFKEILEESGKIFNKVSVNSNGTFSNDICQNLVSSRFLSHVTISLDGNKKSHDAIRGDGVFDKAIVNIKKLVENAIPVMVSTTVNKNNLNSIFELASVLEHLNISIWKISPVQSYTKEQFNEMLLPNEWNRFVDSIIQKTKLKINIRKYFDFELFDKMEKKYGKNYLMQNTISNCGFCKNKFYIYPDYSIFPCTCLTDLRIGNLKDLTKQELDKKIIEYQKYTELKNPTCIKCKWNYLCNGGCPGYSYYFFGEMGKGDIRCPLLDNYKKLVLG